MGREPRIQTPGTLHHVTARGNNGEPIFVNRTDRLNFVDRLRDASAESRWTVLSYCLMTTHVHLLLRLGTGGISAGMHSLLTGHSHRFNAVHNRQGHVFGGRFHTSLMEDEEHLPAAFRYLAWNPCKAGLVQLPEQWPWSAHRALLGLETPAGGLDVDAAYAYCDGRRGYHGLTRDAPETLEEILSMRGARSCTRALAGGFTQAEIAHALGISQSAVSRRLKSERS